MLDEMLGSSFSNFVNEYNALNDEIVLYVRI